MTLPFFTVVIWNRWCVQHHNLYPQSVSVILDSTQSNQRTTRKANYHPPCKNMVKPSQTSYQQGSSNHLVLPSRESQDGRDKDAYSLVACT